jgi:hypothetical protein
VLDACSRIAAVCCARVVVVHDRWGSSDTRSIRASLLSVACIAIRAVGLLHDAIDTLPQSIADAGHHEVIIDAAVAVVVHAIAGRVVGSAGVDR